MDCPLTRCDPLSRRPSPRMHLNLGMRKLHSPLLSKYHQKYRWSLNENARKGDDDNFFGSCQIIFVRYIIFFETVRLNR